LQPDGCFCHFTPASRVGQDLRDGVTFQAIEAEGLEKFLEQLREELVRRRYRPDGCGR